MKKKGTGNGLAVCVTTRRLRREFKASPFTFCLWVLSVCVPEGVWLLHCTHNKPLSDWQNQYLAIALPCAHSGGSVCSPRHASQFHKHNVRSREKGPAFWLMSPWQLHNSWIVLAIHLSFAKHNLGCVFGEGWLERKSYGLPLSSALSSAHTHTNSKH